ncbi:MAG: class I SAM-dependent methyltransferase [Labilithrix sp.]
MSSYVPALGVRWLTRFYEPVVRYTMRDDEMKGLIVDALALVDGMRVADVGCGPGALALRIAATHPNVEVVGVDGDPEVLATARAKAQAEGARIRFVEGLAMAPPLENAAFDRVVMSLVLHHLAPEDKKRALRAAHDLLRPGGEIHVIDWGGARSVVMRAAFLSIQLLDGFANTADHVRGALPAYLREASFANVAERRRERTICGVVSFYRGTRS